MNQVDRKLAEAKKVAGEMRGSPLLTLLLLTAHNISPESLQQEFGVQTKFPIRLSEEAFALKAAASVLFPPEYVWEVVETVGGEARLVVTEVRCREPVAH